VSTQQGAAKLRLAGDRRPVDERRRRAPSEAQPPRVRTHEQALERADRFAASVAESAITRDRSGELPTVELAELDRSGLLGITIPAAYGGPELSVVTLAEVIRRVAAVDPSLAQASQGHFLMVDVLAVWGTDRARQRLYEQALAGRRLGNALAERGGQHAQDLKTRLLAGADGLRLTGRKYYCTGALTSAWLGVSALDDDGLLTLAFVARDAEGVTLDRDWNVMGQRATVSGGASFDDVAVDAELVIPYHHAFAVPQQLGARAQLVHTAIQVGIAGGALRDAREFITKRARPFFEAARAGLAPTAAEDPTTILRFGRMATKLRAAETLLADAAATQAAIGREPADAELAARGSVAVAQAKAFASEVAAEIASDLFALTGASAADARYDLDRHWRNARTHAAHDPVDWKFHHVGNYLLNGTLPPNHGQL
jgi:SfnB family sulfur acquisition oxidoreductase